MNILYLLTLIHCVNSAKCPPKKFKCDIVRCIDKDLKCNGIYNCLDKTDEKKCKNKCLHTFNQFACDNNKKCINRSKVCDNNYDCLDKTDEDNCQPISTKTTTSSFSLTSTTLTTKTVSSTYLTTLSSTTVSSITLSTLSSKTISSTTLSTSTTQTVSSATLTNISSNNSATFSTTISNTEIIIPSTTSTSKLINISKNETIPYDDHNDNINIHQTLGNKKDDSSYLIYIFISFLVILIVIFSIKKKCNKNQEQIEINNLNTKDLYTNNYTNNTFNNEYLEPVPLNLNYEQIPEYAEVI